VLVAKALGISQQTVSKKLRGETAILLSDLERIARKFKLPVTWFFEGYGRKDLPSDRAA
jgi:transcriptional regulator with XRE-family HTH domain